MELTLEIKKGVKELMSEVVDAGLCSVCGACVGVCPYIKVYRERVVALDDCGLGEGQCYNVCPRTRSDYEALNKRVFKRGRDDFLLGAHKSVVYGRAVGAEVREAGQYGGVVSALARFALDGKTADSAIMAKGGTNFPLLPKPALIDDPDMVLDAAGSRYTACPSLSLLDRALKSGLSPLVVGRGCQVTATRKKQAANPEAGSIPLLIGLFCMWALNYRELEKYLLDKIDIGNARKFDIPMGRFVVEMKDGSHVELDFDEIKKLRLNTCDLCYDFTAELADISVGSTEMDDDWNTVIIRSDAGERLWRGALDDGVVEEKPFIEERLQMLKKAAEGKKKRALRLLQERSGGDEGGLGYLALSSREAEEMLE